MTSLRDRAKAAARVQEEQAEREMRERLEGSRETQTHYLLRHLHSLLGEEAPTYHDLLAQQDPPSHHFAPHYRNEDGLTFVLRPDGGANGNSHLHAGFFCPYCGHGLEGRTQYGRDWETHQAWNLAALGKIYERGEQTNPSLWNGRSLFDRATNGCDTCQQVARARELGEQQRAAEAAAQAERERIRPQGEVPLEGRDGDDYPPELPESAAFRSINDDNVKIRQPFEDETGRTPVNPITYYDLTIDDLCQMYRVPTLTVCRWMAKWVTDDMP